MFIPSYLISLDLVVPTHWGHPMPLMVSLQPFLIRTLILPWVTVSIKEGPAPLKLFPLSVACIQDMACLLLFPNLFTTIFPNLLIFHIRSLVLQLLQH